jgi:cell wall-associated NlpC family hydrolase
MKKCGKLILSVSVLSASLMLSGLSPVFAASFPRGIVTGNHVNLRVKPGLQSKVIRQVNSKNVVSVLGNTKGWYNIKLSDGTKGWMSSTYVSLRDKNVSRAGVERDIVDFAKRFLGVGYVYGGSSEKGFDCSGFTSYVYKNFGVNLPRTAAGQSTAGTAVGKNDLQVGDLVLFKTLGSSKVNHAGIYIGDGNFIHSSSGSGEVRIDSLSSNYYTSHYATSRHVL